MPFTPLLHPEHPTAATGRQPSGRLFLAGIATMVMWSVMFTGLTAVVVRANGPTEVDIDGMQWIVQHRTKALTVVAEVLAILGGTVCMTLLAMTACGLLIWQRQWDAAILVGVTGFGAGVLVVVLKYLVGRDRPPVTGSLASETSHAYPSGHSLGSFVVIGIVMIVALRFLHGIVHRVLPAAAAIVVAAVGLSRIYLGVHWPTDVLAGWILGALWLTLCLTVFGYVSTVLARDALRES
ncbi:phosphatase PAP2 family protein [Nocardia sp. NPDC050406]|uniref:phosphatase PAP2 family protein n=1 Tax=Nocardia sp. NPDC050406 TaxID=3364318 RepID=UPI0037A7064C